MANEVKIKITAESTGTKAPIADVREGLESVETAADKAGNGLKDVDRELAKMDAQIVASRMELKRLAHEFANVDDASQRIDIGKSMRKVQQEIAQATRAQKALKFSDLIPDEPDERSFGKLRDGLMSISTKAGASVGPVLGSSIGIAAAPLVASTLAGGIIGGIGIGGMVGGVAMAAKDPRVSGEFKTMGNVLKERMKDGASGFVQPTLEGIGIIKKSLDTVDIEGIFEDSAQHVTVLARGIGGAIESLGDGIEDVAANAGPAVQSIANGLDTLGDSIGQGLSSLADNGDQAAESLDTVFTALGHVTDGTFALINGTMELTEFLDDFAGGALALDGALQLVNRTLDDGSGTMGHYRAGADDASDGIQQVGETSEETARKSSALAAALKEVEDALKNEVDPVFKLLDAQDGLREAQDKVAESTKKHGENSQETKAALRELAGKAIDLESAVRDLGGSFDGKMTPALRSTLRAAGLTEGQISDLEKQFRTARRAGGDFARQYVAKLRVDGYPAVYRQLYSVNDILNDIPRAVNIAMKITGVQSASAAAAAIRKNMGQAHGGIVGAAANGATSNGLTLVGEHGPELAQIVPGGRVWSNPDTQRMMRGHGLGSERDQDPKTLQISAAPGSGSRLMDELVRSLRIEIMNRTGGNVQRYLGQGV